ncbi:MAG: hemolysin family protein [Planctomycetota bacterium]|jgi:CBS domain containing-hemolysin-like protein
MEFTWKVVLMVALLGGSAFFSGSETAFFNLTRRQINQFRKSKHKLHKLVCELLDDPKKLLSSLLFGNMVVNVLFFATSSVLIVKIERQFGPTAATITAFVSFGSLVLLGEIVPKSLSFGNSIAISVAAAVPAFLCIKIFSPLIFFFRFFLVEPILRLILGPGKPPKPISANEFKAFISQVKNRGLISPYENILLSEIIEFGFLKVRDCMQPRVDMVSCDIGEASENARDLMIKNQQTKLPVYHGEIDNIVGMIYLRDLLLKAELSLGKLIKPAHFIPEQKTLESLLEFFRDSQIDTAVVVDEYGGIAGMIRLEDIAEELVGPIDAETEAELRPAWQNTQARRCCQL